MINRLVVNVAKYESRKLLKMCISNLIFISPVLSSDCNGTHFITLLLEEMRWWSREEIKAGGFSMAEQSPSVNRGNAPFYKSQIPTRRPQDGYQSAFNAPMSDTDPSHKRVSSNSFPSDNSLPLTYGESSENLKQINGSCQHIVLSHNLFIKFSKDVYLTFPTCAWYTKFFYWPILPCFLVIPNVIRLNCTNCCEESPQCICNRLPLTACVEKSYKWHCPSVEPRNCCYTSHLSSHDPIISASIETSPNRTCLIALALQSCSFS